MKNRMKRYLLSPLLLLGLGMTANAQTTIFYDNFGSPAEATGRRESPYMPSGSGLTYADPSIGTDDAKKIGKNFYAVVGPKSIYSSGYGSGSSWPNNWGEQGQYYSSGIAKDGDITQGDNGTGGALVVNASATVSSFYVRTANLVQGKLYKLSYTIYVQSGVTQLNHKVLASDGSLVTEKNMSSNVSPTNQWKLVEVWFQLPAGSPTEEYNIVLANAVFNDSNPNAFAIDELRLEQYDSSPV